MKKFTSISAAFEWWLNNIYPGLSPETKKGKLVQAWKDYNYKQGISERRMIKILTEFGDVEVKTVVFYRPK